MVDALCSPSGAKMASCNVMSLRQFSGRNSGSFERKKVAQQHFKDIVSSE